MEGIIEMRKMDFLTKYRKLDIRNFSYKLMSNIIKNLVINTSSIYFNTYGGDFIKLKLVITKNESKDDSITLRVVTRYFRKRGERIS